MSNEAILYEKDKKRKVATIIFNKPEKLNAQTMEDYRKLTDLIVRAAEDDEVKVLVMKGAGRCFSSGMDVGELGVNYGYGTGEPGERRPSERIRVIRDSISWGRRGLLQTIYACPKATIAQVHGYCYGQGLEMALACDITIAAEDSLFTHPGYRYIGSVGNIVFFLLTIGVKKTKEMMLTGVPLNASEALQCGLVNKVVPLDKLEEEVNKMAEALARIPSDAIVMGKAHFEAALDIAGVGAGFTLGRTMHSFQTNIRYEPDEFNLFKARRDKGGVKAAIKARKTYYGETETA